MAFRHALLAAAIIGIAAAAIAQTTTTPPAPGPSAAHTASARDTTVPAASEAKKLLGRSVKSRDGETVGKIESVYVAPGGEIDSVMVGLADHEVQVARKDLQIADNGEKVTVELTKDQLKAMAPYSYKDAAWRGKVFGERGVWSDDQRPTTDADRTESTGDFNVAGDVSATALIGAKIRNENKDTVGTVEDLFVDDQGAISTVVVSVGGFLGVGARSVGVRWSDVRRSRDGNSVVLLTNLGKDELKALPPYVVQLRKPAPKDQAAAPR
jgi:sporulation protein YlmC with PRC-barrel domain